ncbi:uncharacterized protein [Macaca nemestrina]|uniref:uncharacterized protein isoform X1 n=1 Tax=Macaca nemestrina TaxID=9545 RepID=UPI0039B8FDDF
MENFNSTYNKVSSMIIAMTDGTMMKHPFLDTLKEILPCGYSWKWLSDSKETRRSYLQIYLQTKALSLSHGTNTTEQHLAQKKAPALGICGKPGPQVCSDWYRNSELRS